MENTSSTPEHGAPSHGCKQPQGHFEPLIDRNRCEGKGPCVSACPLDVLAMGVLDAHAQRQLSFIGRVKAWAHGGQQAFVVRPDACAACGECVRACPEEAITLRRRRGVTPGT